jgi:hypothetical protein
VFVSVFPYLLVYTGKRKENKIPLTDLLYNISDYLVKYAKKIFLQKMAYFLKILANIERKNISFFGDLLTSQKENVILIKN